MARGYVMAGYSVEFMHPTRYGPIHIVARGNGQRLAVEVFDKPLNVSIDVVRNLLEKSKLIGAKPILVLYSKGSKVAEEVRRYCAENGIKIRRIRID